MIELAFVDIDAVFTTTANAVYLKDTVCIGKRYLKVTDSYIEYLNIGFNGSRFSVQNTCVNITIPQSYRFIPESEYKEVRKALMNAIHKMKLNNR